MYSSTMTRDKLRDQEPGSCLPPCRVCGDQAAGYHYGVNTCEACKGFFHRSLRRHKEYTCRANRTSGYCEYKPGKRKSCQFCRYQRCLIAGMSKEAIKTGRYTYSKRMNDTREIKRLQNLQHHLYWDSPELASPLSFMSTPSPEYNIAELPVNEFYDNSFVEVDTVTKEEFERLLMSEYNHGRRVYLPDSSSLWPSKSLKCKSHNKPTTSMTNSSLYCNLERPMKQFLLSRENIQASSLGLVTDASQLLPLSKVGTSRFVRPISNVLYNPENRFAFTNERCPKTHGHLANVRCGRQHVRKSVIHRKGRIDKTRNVEDYIWRQMRNRDDHSESNQQAYLTRESPESLEDTSDSFNSSSSYTCNSNMADSVEVESENLEMPTLECDSEKMSEPDFDLFPDISVNLNGQPPSSPSSFPNEDLETPILDPAGQCTTATSHRPTRSPRVTAFNLHTASQQQCCDNITVYQESRLSCTKQTQNCINEAEDKDMSQGMNVYKQCLDLTVDSRPCTQPSTLGQPFLTAPNSPDLDPLVSTSCRPVDTNYIHNTPSTSIPHSGVKDGHPFSISELYKDKDAVIAALMASYKVNVEDYCHIPKEEMFAQQKAHYETCQLQKQTFGCLGFLPEQEYDEIYSVTGIDVDNRRLMIHKFLAKMEKDVRSLVQFAKSIPGFSYLDIHLQMELVKLAQNECSMLSHYRTVNSELGIMIGLTGEHWACYYELGTDEVQATLTEYVLFSDKLQKMAPTQEEEVLLKAIVVVSTDGDTPVSSPLAEAIRWQLVMCLLHSLEKHRDQPSLFLARYILALTQSRTVAESTKEFLRKMKLRKYSSIEQNPLLWEICSWIVLDKRDDDPRQQQRQNTAGRKSSLGAHNSFAT